MGRFISEDPIRSDELGNAYRYVNNAPHQLLDPLGLCTLSGKMSCCLAGIFGEACDKVELVHKQTEDPAYSAITRKNKITIYIPCEAFWGSPELVLEEYYHVLRQWNTGKLTKFKYLIEWIKKGYWNNKYEVEARAFASANAQELTECLGQ